MFVETYLCMNEVRTKGHGAFVVTYLCMSDARTKGNSL